MKIAITGANGFLGSYLVQEFLHKGFEVIALVRPSANISTLPEEDNLSIESVDYKLPLSDQIEQLKSKHGALDYFLHNAGVTVSLDKSEYFEINTNLTQKLVAAIQRQNWLEGKFIQLSSFAAQGPMGINHPVSIYGESKLRAEKFVIDSSFEHLIVRPTGIYGAGDYAFLPLFKMASKGLYPLTNKYQKMSMIHAQDLARIIVDEATKSQGVIHVNDGKTYLHDDFVNALQKAVNKKIQKIPLPAWITKISLGLSDIWHTLIRKRPGLTREKFQEISMDWNLQENENLEFSNIPPQISLEEGFRDAYEFYKTKKLL